MRPPTYYQKCRDQQWYINQLEVHEGQLLAQLADYKERLAIELNRSAAGQATSTAAAAATPSGERPSVPLDAAAPQKVGVSGGNVKETVPLQSLSAAMSSLAVSTIALERCLAPASTSATAFVNSVSCLVC